MNECENHEKNSSLNSKPTSITCLKTSGQLAKLFSSSARSVTGIHTVFLHDPLIRYNDLQSTDP